MHLSHEWSGFPQADYTWCENSSALLSGVGCSAQPLVLAGCFVGLDAWEGLLVLGTAWWDQPGLGTVLAQKLLLRQRLQPDFTVGMATQAEPESRTCTHSQPQALFFLFLIFLSGQQIPFLCAPLVDISEVDIVVIKGQRWKAAGKNKQKNAVWIGWKGGLLGSYRDELQGLANSMGS